jgi:hypothetical protein
VAVRLALLPVQPPPEPEAHDEFSYLLAAQTFANGHLANHTPPLPEHFETFHVNMRPTYHSMYPPAQGAWLAVGIILFGSPWAGVCLSIAALCGSICWALFACMSRNYAFLAGVIVALRIGIHSYWIDSFVGGAVAGVGGALVLGGTLRFIRKASARNAVVVAFGLALLGASRPYEGLAFTLPVSAMVVISLARKRPLARKDRTASTVLVACCLLFACFLAFYNYRCTGSPIIFPEQLNIKHYHQFGAFLWASPNGPGAYPSDRMGRFYRGSASNALAPLESFRNLATFEMQKLKEYDRFFVFPFLPFLLLGTITAIRRPKQRLLALTLLSTAVASLFVVWHHPHYIAPALVSIVGLLVHSIREIRHFRLGTATSMNISLLLTISLVLYSLSVVAGVSSREPSDDAWGRDRASMESMLKRLAGTQLVFVHYASDNQDDNIEWVFNGPEIQNQKVIWARSLNPEADLRLIRMLRPASTWDLVAHSDYWTIRPDTALDQH